MLNLLIFLVKLLDPVTIVLAMGAGAISRAWWHVAVAAFVVAAIVEMTFFAIQNVRTFNPIEFGIGIVAAAVWVALAFSFFKKRRAAHTGDPAKL
jgi:hypothetical protein